MKRLLVALAVAALLAIFTVPALASQNRPSDPVVQLNTAVRAFKK